MQYFNGFGLRGDYILFSNLLRDFGYKQTSYDIVGFSSGALLALQYAMNCISQKKRIGKLILISPLLYSHCISQDSMLNMKHDTLRQTYNKLDLRQLDMLFNFMPCITHVSFERIVRKFSHIPINILWNLFIHACFNTYKKDRLGYHYTLYEQIGFNNICLKKQHSIIDMRQCRVFTHFENIDILRNMWSICPIDFQKIKQKSQMFVIIISEHDKIINSKLIGEYLSQFGICYILKGCNHILQKRL